MVLYHHFLKFLFYAHGVLWLQIRAKVTGSCYAERINPRSEKSFALSSEQPQTANMTGALSATHVNINFLEFWNKTWLLGDLTSREWQLSPRPRWHSRCPPASHHHIHVPHWCPHPRPPQSQSPRRHGDSSSSESGSRAQPGGTEARQWLTGSTEPARSVGERVGEPQNSRQRKRVWKKEERADRL